MSYQFNNSSNEPCAFCTCRPCVGPHT